MRILKIFSALSIYALLSPANFVHAQTTGTADSGKRIILNSNGTWRYNKADTGKHLSYSELTIKLAEQVKLTLLQEKIAEQNLSEALTQKSAADRQRYLSVAKAAALKSLELNDPEQKLLVAMQAYNFNVIYKGYPYDNDIYRAILSALRRYNHPITRSFEGHHYAVRALATSATDGTIFSGGSDGKIMRWTFKDKIWKGETLIPPQNDYQIYSLDLSPDGHFMAVGGHQSGSRNESYVELFDLRNPESTFKKISGFVSDIDNIHFTPNSMGFYSRSNSGRSIMYSDLVTANEVTRSDEKINSLQLNPAGTLLAGAGAEGNLYIWDIQNNYSPKTYNIFASGKGISSIAFLWNNNDLAIGDEDGEIRIVSNGTIRRVLSGHTSKIEQILFSHSGQFMATASMDGTVRLWNLRDLNQQPIVMSEHDWIWSMAFSADDNQLMAGLHSSMPTVKNIDFSIGNWPTQIPSMTAELCSLLARNLTKEEWDTFFYGLPYESSCPNLPANNK